MDAEAQEQAKPPKKKTKLIILLIVAVMAMGAGAYWYLAMGPGKSASAKKDLMTVTLPSCTVNLADIGGKRYLKTTITLEYSSKGLEEELPKSLYRVKDSILRVLRSTTVNELDTPEKMEVLKQELLQAVNSQLTGGQISGLYFEEFLVQ